MECNGSRRDVVLKVPTTAPRGEGRYRYVKRSFGEMARVREVLLGGSDGDSAARHFNVEMGTSSVPIAVLHESVEEYARVGGEVDTRCLGMPRGRNGGRSSSRDGADESPEGETATGSVMPSAPGRKLHPDAIARLSPAGRTGVARDFVRMYRRMHDRGFVHQDISSGHIYYDGGTGGHRSGESSGGSYRGSVGGRDDGSGVESDGNSTAAGTTSLIDFQRHQILRTPPEATAANVTGARHRSGGTRKRDEELRRAQLHQLLTLLANVCFVGRGPHGRHGAMEFRVPNRVEDDADVGNVRELLEAMGRCGDDGGGEDAGEGRALLERLSRAFEGGRTAKSYRILASWAGADGDKS